MAGAQVDADNELRVRSLRHLHEFSQLVNKTLYLQNMVMCFRVSELQVLLGHAGRNKSGRKHELMTRALQLVRSSGCNKAVSIPTTNIMLYIYN